MQNDGDFMNVIVLLSSNLTVVIIIMSFSLLIVQGGLNMTGTDLYVNKPHCAAAVRP